MTLLLGKENAKHVDKFWEQDPLIWDTVNNVGLRANYIASVYAARLMVKRGSGIIVNMSSPGGLTYLFNTAYGVGKAAQDRMAADFNHELKGLGIRNRIQSKLLRVDLVGKKKCRSNLVHSKSEC